MTPEDRGVAASVLRAEREASRSLAMRASRCRDPELAGLLMRGGLGARARADRVRGWLDAAPSGAAAPPRDAAPSAVVLPAPEGAAMPAPPANAAPGVVFARREVGPDVVVLRLGRPRGLGFRPGQFVRIGLNGASRRYSIASAPDEPHLELAIERVPGGRLSPRLHALRPGDRVTLGGAGGGFLLDPKATVHFMVATVTGVVPFVSMIRHALRTGAPGRFVLLHGASYRNELAFADELAALAKAHPDRLTYVPAVSRPAEPRNAGWRGETGRLGPLAARLAPPAAGRRVYACGHPGMIADVRQRFGGQVVTEAYF
jgi:ferredoxin-NADP reductase